MTGLARCTCVLRVFCAGHGKGSAPLRHCCGTPWPARSVRSAHRMPLTQGAPARRGSSTCGRARTAQSGGMRSVKAHVRRSMRERPARGACRSRACTHGSLHRGTGSNTTHADELSIDADGSAVLLGSLTCAGQSATSWHTMGCTCTDESSARTCERRPVHWSCASSLNHSVEAIDTPIIVQTRPTFRDQPSPHEQLEILRKGWVASGSRE